MVPEVTSVAIHCSSSLGTTLLLLLLGIPSSFLHAYVLNLSVLCSGPKVSSVEVKAFPIQVHGPFMCQEATNPPTDTAFQKILSSPRKKKRTESKCWVDPVRMLPPLSFSAHPGLEF